MAPLLNARGLTQTFGAVPLFREIAVSISENERLGLIGPNGSGKSTLLEILAAKRQPDDGEVAIRKGTRVGYVAQDSKFQPGETIRQVIRRALDRSTVPEDERLARESENLGRVGFSDFDAEAAAL